MASLPVLFATICSVPSELIKCHKIKYLAMLGTGSSSPAMQDLHLARRADLASCAHGLNSTVA